MIRFWMIGTSSAGISTPSRPGDHQALRRLEDFVEIVDALAVFDLGDDRLAAAVFLDDPADFPDIAGAADERGSDEIDIFGDPEGDIVDILIGQGRQIDDGVGQADPFPAHQAAAGDHPGDDVAALDPDDGEGELAVVEKNRMAFLRLGGEFRIIDGDAGLRAGSRIRGDGQLLAVLKDQVGLQVADPDLGTAGVEEDGGVGIGPASGLLHQVDESSVGLPVAVGEIDPGDIHAGIDEGEDLVLRLAAGTEGGDDLGLVHGLCIPDDRRGRAENADPDGCWPGAGNHRTG